ncbi:alternate-type signal peptide domain-containing protein [Dietzia lutea]|uniref:Alternate-type signal peptide domain-containing protein n=1 Tax=Dietzia lutea TaxID=546160 RepID=A0A2S1R9D3_9ACTN|nr:alternate-type signal peptide domain-containing protein [Dietzia lutea]AWH92872.1 hypothetical protein A6035_12635 [Dietzia lutea]
MKKTTKGALAAGAAAVLLAGGAGTFAAWTESGDATPGASVQTGSLGVTQVANSASWTWADGTAFDPNSDTLVPGDSIEFTGRYLLDVEGSNLRAELVATSGTSALPAGLEWTPNSGNTLTDLSEVPDDNTEVTVGGTLTFAPGADASMNETITVNELTVTISQTAPASVPAPTGDA